MMRTRWAIGLGLVVPLAACGALVSIDDRYYVPGGDDAQAVDHTNGADDSGDAGRADGDKGAGCGPNPVFTVGNISLSPAISVALNSDNTLSVFGLTASGASRLVTQARQESAASNTYTCTTMGLEGSSTPIPGVDLDGRLELFVRSGSTAYRIAQMTPSGAFGSWTAFAWDTCGPGMAASTVVPVRDGRNALQVAVVDFNGKYDSASQRTPGSSSWTNWASLPATTPMGFLLQSDPVPVLTADGLDIFFRSDHETIEYYRSSTGQWLNIAPTNVIVLGTPAVVLDRAGLMNVFAVGTNNGLYVWQQPPSSSGAPFQNWNAIALNTDLHIDDFQTVSPVVVQDDTEYIHVFSVDTGFRLQHNAQTATGWVPTWDKPGSDATFTVTSAPAVALDSSRHFVVFARGTDNQLHHIVQTASGGWDGWYADCGNWVASP